jgi:hypothetical protein
VPAILDRWHAHRADLIASGQLAVEVPPSGSAPRGSDT